MDFDIENESNTDVLVTSKNPEMDLFNKITVLKNENWFSLLKYKL